MEPGIYFDNVKNSKRVISEEDLSDFHDNCILLLNKYKKAGQIKAAKKIIFLLETIEREKEIVKLGIDSYVNYEDIENYIDNISKDVVKIIELKNYERDIPDNIIKVIESVGDKFDQMYVVFTDYTGKVQRQVEKERIEKDPILFGTFQDKKEKSFLDRFYFLGDWEDEYCDLTLGRMAFETKAKTGENLIFDIHSMEDVVDLKRQLELIEASEKDSEITQKARKSLLSRVLSFFRGQVGQ